MEFDEHRDALIAAAQKGSLDAAAATLERAPPEVIDALSLEGQRWAALHWAASTGHLEMCRLLLRSGADPDVRSGKLVKNGELRRDWYWDPGETPLIIASQQGHLAVVDLLLESGANVTRSAVEGWTALHAAVTQDDPSLVERLVTAGIDPQVVSHRRHFLEELGWYLVLTPVHVAALRPNLQAVQVLVRYTQTMPACWLTRRTPLHFAAASGDADVIRALCEGGADPNAREHRHGHGYFSDLSPLHYAAQNGHRDAVEMLLKFGAEPRAVESQARSTPLEMAREEGHQHVAAILSEAMHEAAGHNTLPDDQ